VEFLLERAPELWVKTLEHLMLTGVSTGVAALIGLPLGVWITRQAALRGVVLGVAGVFQTIPSLAMLAFLLPFLGIGVKPALAALTLYAVLPILRNTYTGLAGVPPEIVEAADGLGFTRRQRLWMVEVPLALPVMVAGIRTATVIGVGIATLSAFIGAGGLGEFINRGLALNNNRLILLGAVPAAVLALALDFAIGTVETLLRPGRLSGRARWRVAILLVLVSLFLFAVLLFHPLRGEGWRGAGPGETRPPLRIGTKNFTEQLILGELMAQRIESETDIRVERLFNLGGTLLCHRALITGGIDLYAEYTGTALTVLLGKEKVSDPEACFRTVAEAYERRFSCRWLSPLGFNSTYTLTVRGEDADRKGWEKVSDLAGEAPTLRAGFTAEFSERPDGYPGLREAYGFGFGRVFDLDPGLMYQAVRQGEVDVICAFSTDGRIPAYGLRMLEDDRGFFPPYHPAPVVRHQALEIFPELPRVLAPLSEVLSDEVMQRLNYRVDEEGHAPEDVVRAFLREAGLQAGQGP